MAVTTPGLSGQQKNRDLFDAGQLSRIEWFSFAWNTPHFGAVTIQVADIAAEPAPPPSAVNYPKDLVDAFAALGQPIPPQVQRAFSRPPSAVFFKSDELLRIMDAVRELQDPDQFLGQEVYVDGRLMLVAMVRLSQACRKARAFFVNVPLDGGFVKVWERTPQNLSELVPGDLINQVHQRPGSSWKVANIGTDQANIQEQGRGRRGQTVWIREGADIAGWA